METSRISAPDVIIDTLEKEIDLKEHLHSSATSDTSGIDCNESLASELFPCDICSEVFFLHENLEKTY